MSEELLLDEITRIVYREGSGLVGCGEKKAREILVKIKIHYEQDLRIKNPFEEKIPVSSVDGEGAYSRGCYDGFERLRRELKMNE